MFLIKGHPLELYFPSGVTGAALDQIERAKAVCCRRARVTRASKLFRAHPAILASTRAV